MINTKHMKRDNNTESINIESNNVKSIDAEIIEHFKHKLDNHPIYDAVETLEDLQCFMQHHIYSVWDFMSLIKYLQSIIAPTDYPWTPQGDPEVRRFINELVLEEESDETNITGTFSSHFELYKKAMLEVGADTTGIDDFLQQLNISDIDLVLMSADIPEPSRAFTQTTFALINANKPHEVAAALALGREHIIPGMFRSILDKIGIDEKQAPIFHYYLNRHIGLDEDFHAPLSLRLLNNLCTGDDGSGDGSSTAEKTKEAISAAETAVNARITFWDGVLDAIKQGK